MSALAERFASTAENLEGIPFRLGGRSREFGADCAGIVALALEECGVKVPPFPPYRLRNASFQFAHDMAANCGLESVVSPTTTRPQRGDIIMAQPGAAQRHLLIALGDVRYLHAHAGLRRAVIMAMALPWPITHIWRLK